MNTEDQAKLFSLGDAFRRRFGFVPVPSLVDSSLPETDSDEREPAIDDYQLSNAETIRSEIVEKAVVDNLTHADILVGELQPTVYLRDAAAVDPVFAVPANVETAYQTAMDPETYGYTATGDILDIVFAIAAFLHEHNMVTIGHSQFIDIAKFLTVVELSGIDRASRDWLDEAIIAFVLPQLDSFFIELREEEAIGRPGVDADEDSKAAKLQGFIDLLEGLGLTRSEVILDHRETGVGII